MGRSRRELAPLFLDFAGGVPDGGGRVLDVGCGTGSLAFAAAGRYAAAEVVGCDIAEPLLAHAARPIRTRAGSASRRATPARCRTGTARSTSCSPGSCSCSCRTGRSQRARWRGWRSRAARSRPRPGFFRGGAVYPRLLADAAATVEETAAAWRDRVQRAVGVRLGGLAWPSSFAATAWAVAGTR